MFSKPAKIWGNGAITLPKKWRDKWGTDSFMLEENAKGYLVIKPIQLNTNNGDEEAIWYENEYDPEDGHYYTGIRFPNGMPMKQFLEKWRETSKRIDTEESVVRRKEKKSRNTDKSKR